MRTKTRLCELVGCATPKSGTLTYVLSVTVAQPAPTRLAWVRLLQDVLVTTLKTLLVRLKVKVWYRIASTKICEIPL